MNGHKKGNTRNNIMNDNTINKVGKNKPVKAVFYTIDSFLAAIIIIAGLMIISELPIKQQSVTTTSLIAQDLLSTLSELKVNEINSSLIRSWIANKTITQNNSVLEQIGVFWALNQTENATKLINLTIGGLIPKNIKFQMFAEQDLLFQNNLTKQFKTTNNAKRVVTGISKGKPISGFSSTAYLRRIIGKHNNRYTYFGGFIGQGNITTIMYNLPIENSSDVKNITLEIDTASDFNIYINGNMCRSVFTPKNISMEPDIWDISDCKSSLHEGDNSFRFVFLNGTNISYIAGGYIRVNYVTDLLLEDIPLGNTTYHFPSVEGLINIYDSFYVPGNLTNITARLRFYSEYPLFFSIGPATFSFQGSNETRDVIIQDNNISQELSSYGLNLSNLSLTTVPIRIGLGEVQINGSSADTVLVTDTSGSMGMCISNNDYPPCPPGDQTKLEAAKNASKEFISYVLSNPGSNIGLVEYGTDIKSYELLTNNQSKLYEDIDSYDASGYTCICCGVNKAVDILTQGGYSVLPRNSNWKYKASQTYSPPPDWTSLDFDDSSWDTGNAPLGRYGGIIWATLLPSYDGDYYFRKVFNITNKTQISSLKLSIAHDDGVIVYLNDNIVYNDYDQYTSFFYWTTENVNIDPSLLQDGENIMAVKLRNRISCLWIWCWDRELGFDLELQASNNTNNTRARSMVVMSDGRANGRCSQQGTGDAKQDAIQAACDAYNNFGISVYTVGFGSDADNDTLQQMADCGHGQYFYASNSSGLIDAYSAIGSQIIEKSKTQVLIGFGNLSRAVLYNDSNIHIKYEPIISNPIGKISVTLQQPITQCVNTITLPDTEFADAKVLSYSGPHWSDLLLVNGHTVFNLSSFGSDYFYLGDPFVIQAPVNYLGYGNNSIVLRLGDSPHNTSSQCSGNNSFIYTALLNSSTTRGEVLEKAEGCIWNIEFEDLSFENISIPSYYNGENRCNYTNVSRSYDPNDAYDVAAYRLFEKLDLNNDGRLFVNLESQDLEIVITSVESVPFLWGPSVMEGRVWS